MKVDVFKFKNIWHMEVYPFDTHNNGEMVYKHNDSLWLDMIEYHAYFGIVYLYFQIIYKQIYLVHRWEYYYYKCL